MKGLEKVRDEIERILSQKYLDGYMFPDHMGTVSYRLGEYLINFHFHYDPPDKIEFIMVEKSMETVIILDTLEDLYEWLETCNL